MTSEKPPDPTETDLETRSTDQPIATGPFNGLQVIKSRLIQILDPYIARFPRISAFIRLVLLGCAAIGFLWGLQAIAQIIPSQAVQSGILFGGLAVILLNSRLRVGMAAASLVYILGASLFFIANHWQGIRSGQLSFDQGVKGVANEVLDNQITSDLTSIYTERFEQAVRLPQRYISARRVSSRTGDFEVSTSQFFRYLGEIRGQESIVRDLAIEQTRECKSGDRGCEIYHLLHYVSEEVKYVSDPRGPYDNIQPPQETTRLAAGDCEDQTILLISMLEAVGIDALIVFTEGHAYPMACIAEQIQSRRWLAREPNIYQFDRAETPYCYPLEPTDPKAQVGYNYEYEDFIYAVDPVTDIHYEFKAAAG